MYDSNLYIAAAIFLPILDFWSYTTIGILLLPNAYWALLVFVITPLACIMGVLANVTVSSRVSDVRAAQQLGGLVVLPLVFVVIFASTTSSISLILVLAVSAALIIADIALFYLSKATLDVKKSL